MRLLRPVVVPFLVPVLAAFSFLTRLPVPARAGGGTVTDADLGRSVVWFPLVGAVLGGAAVGIERLARGHLAPGLIAVLLVAASALLTGGLHLDGLADTFDAWGGGRGDRARMLEIMRDSRIGAHGAVALFLVLAGKIFAVIQLQLPPQHLLQLPPRLPLDLFERGVIWPLLAAPLLARWAVVPLIVLFPYARPAGLGTAFRAHAGLGELAGATVLPLALAIGTSLIGTGDWGAMSIWTAGAAALGVALVLGALLARRLGGLTGDVYGAAIELAELAVLITASR